MLVNAAGVVVVNVADVAVDNNVLDVVVDNVLGVVVDVVLTALVALDVLTALAASIAGVVVLEALSSPLAQKGDDLRRRSCPLHHLLQGSLFMK
jgi:hypothetical protein